MMKLAGHVCFYVEAVYYAGYMARNDGQLCALLWSLCTKIALKEKRHGRM